MCKVYGYLPLWILLSSLTVSSCKFFGSEKDRVVVKVYDDALTESDLKKITHHKNKAIDDNIVQNYIDHWVKKKVLLKAFKDSIPRKKIQEFDKLVAEYEEELILDFYRKKILNNFGDTVITEEEINDYYENHQNHLLLKESMYKLAFVQTDDDKSSFLNSCKRALRRFRKFDSIKLADESLKLHSYYLDNNQWLSLSEIIKLIPSINHKNYKRYLNTSNHYAEIRLPEKKIILIHVFDKKDPQTISPLEVVTPLIKNIIMKKRRDQYLKIKEERLIKASQNAVIYYGKN